MESVQGEIFLLNKHVDFDKYLRAIPPKRGAECAHKIIIAGGCNAVSNWDLSKKKTRAVRL